jgi:phospholipase/carboxylesterase
MAVDRGELAVAAAVSVAGVVVGVATGAALHRLIVGPPADCSQAEVEGGVVAGVPYLERMRGGAAPDETVPMVVLFHSLGASPEGHSKMLTNIGKARLILPEGVYESATGPGHKWWELGVKAAVERDPEGAAIQWEAASERMAEFLRQIVQCRPTIGKPILTGSSQGGEMTLLMASTHPKLARSGVAVSSYLLEPFWTPRVAPTTMIHGTGDTTVPYAWAKDYAEKMQERGAPLAFESYQSMGHAVTKPMSRTWIGMVRSEVEQTWGVLAA